MNWLDELDELLNKTPIEELEEKWAKYNEFDFGPDLVSFIHSSMEFSFDQIFHEGQEIFCQAVKDGYSLNNDEFALAA